MKDEPLKTLHVRNFPENLRLKCKAKALHERETLEQFVKRVLRDATKDVPEPKARPK